MTRPWRALAVLCIANFLVLLDTTIVNTAAPNLMSTLDVGLDELLWVLNGYLLAFASLLIVFGRLGDMVGPRPLFLAGLGLFTLASLLCGLAQSAELLIGARVLQGIGAAMLSPQALVLISAIFPADRRGAAFGIFTAVAGIAAVSGPTLGGLLVTEFGWQSVFYLNVPVGLAGIVLAVKMVPDLRPGRRHRFDIVGVLLATAALLAFVYGLVEDHSAVVFIGSAVLLVLFLVWEKHQPEPLVPFRLYRNRNYTIATAITLIVSFSISGFLLVYVIETQTLLGMSPLASGVSGLPWTLTLSALAPVAGRLADRVGGRVLLIVGLAAYAAGVLGIALVSTGSSTAATFIVPLVVIGIGQGLAIAPATTEAMRDIAPELAGAASGVLNTARHVGTALGAAVVGALLASNRTLAGFDRATIVVAAVVLGGSVLACFMTQQLRPRSVPARSPVATTGSPRVP